MNDIEMQNTRRIRESFNTAMKVEQEQTRYLSNPDCGYRMPVIEKILMDAFKIPVIVVIPVGDTKKYNNLKLQKDYHIDVFAVFPISKSSVNIIPIDIKYNYKDKYELGLWYHTEEHKSDYGIIEAAHNMYINKDTALRDILNCITTDEYNYLNRLLYNKQITLLPHMFLAVHVENKEVISDEYAAYSTDKVYYALSQEIHNNIKNIVQNNTNFKIEDRVSYNDESFKFTFYKNNNGGGEKYANICLHIRNIDCFKYTINENNNI